MSKEFEAYLAKHGLEPEEGVKFVDSSFEEANNSITEEQSNVLDASYSEEVRRLLRGSSDLMSTSMKVRLLIKMPEDSFFIQMILDGGSPSSAVTSSSSLPGLSGRSCGSTTTLTALCNDLMVEKVKDNIDSLNNENANPNISLTDNQVDLKHGDNKTDEETAAAPRRGVKRRSLTETGEMVRPLQVKLKIVIED